MGPALAALNTVAFLLCVSFIAYVVLILVPYLRHRPATPGEPTDFAWHILIPCRNEEEVIGATITSLRSRFPAAHLWVIDDDSTDATGAILADLARRSARVHVVTRRPPDAATGKGPALNAGWRAIRAFLPPSVDAERVIVGVLDADARLDPAAAGIIAGEAGFADPKTGAVQIKVRVEIGPGGAPSRARRLLVRLQDMEFSGPIAAMQLLRRHIGSVGMGGNGQFTRLAVLDRVADAAGTPWHGALLEDFELGLHVLLSGSRTQYCHDTWVAQDGLAYVKPLVRQRSRWCQGSMQCLRYLGAILRCSHISTAGAVELAYFLLQPWLQLLGTVVYPVTMGVMAWYAFSEPGGVSAWWAGGAWGLLPLAAAFGLAPFALWGFVYRSRVDRSIGLRGALVMGLANWAYSYLQQVSSWWAVGRMIRNRHDWKKTAHHSVDDLRAPTTSGVNSTLVAGFTSAGRPVRAATTARFAASRTAA